MLGILPYMPDQSPESQMLNESIDDNFELQRLITKVAIGDKQAFETLYNLTVDRLFGLALRISQSPDAAEDVLSDVYLQVWQQASQYTTDRGSVMAWLSVICRSRALDRVRKRQRIAEKEESMEDYPVEDSVVAAAGFTGRCGTGFGSSRGIVWFGCGFASIARVSLF